MNAEQQRLAENNKDERWHSWGPYLAERAWGTVREDYSANGDAWNYFPHDHARSRAFRWGEDGIGGICDSKQRLCLAFAFWNGQDPFLKERFFGVTGPEGNHGEDVKEIYFYTDATPTHSYMRMLYRYPQRRFPYEELVAANHHRPKSAAEPKLWDTGVLEGDRYFDIALEYAKVDPNNFFVTVTATNRGPDPAPLHVLPTLWFRNTWSWGRNDYRPSLRASSGLAGSCPAIHASHRALGEFKLRCEGARQLLFTENETNAARLFAAPNGSSFVKDGINDFVVHGRRGTVNPEQAGTKGSAHYAFTIKPGATKTIRLWFGRVGEAPDRGECGEPGKAELPVSTPLLEREAFERFDSLVRLRKDEADEFYASRQSACLSEEHRMIHRQALAGMLWSKQFYYYVVDHWLEGDPGQPAPPAERKTGRNSEWRHLYNERVMSMPDKWEYPWYAAWDLAFHCIPLALVDPLFAKGQLDSILREWYQHPNGQVPAYEWNFGDVNPPVIGWAAWRVYKIEEKQSGKGDRDFLETVFHKLLIAFTWWVNRKDSEGKNIFQGGFLGLDNIGVFDRSAPLPGGGHLEQSDGTSWMGMFCLNLMRMALELARQNAVYENIATKFFEHFLAIAGAMNNLGGRGIGLWDNADEFYYDVLHMPGGRYFPLRVRSLVGLMPLLAVETIEPELLDALPGFKARLEWYLENQPALASLISRWQEPGSGDRRLIALTRGHRMKRLLRRMLDPNEFLSDYGVRSLSKAHAENPYVLHLRDGARTVRYEPGESQSNMFGGNSNWRGPVWLPINYLLIESLQKFHHYYGEDFKVECPTGSGRFLTLKEIANELSNRLIQVWLRNEQGVRPFQRSCRAAFNSERDRDLYWFHEYFHGDTGAGLGASHQTGWTGLIAKLIEQQGQGGTIAKRDPFTDL